MKLTNSTDLLKNRPLNKVTALKGLIQQAASQSNNESVTINVLRSSQSHLNIINYNCEDPFNAPKKKASAKIFHKTFQDQKQQDSHFCQALDFGSFRKSGKQNLILNKNKQNDHQQYNNIQKDKNLKFSKSSSNLLGNFKSLRFGRVKQMQNQRDGINFAGSIDVKKAKIELGSKQQGSKKSNLATSLQMKPSFFSESSSFKSISIKQLTKKRFTAKRSSHYSLSIQRFQLGKKIGKGRFGSVYIAQDKQTKFLLAIKTINKKQMKEASMQEQLLAEIKLQMYMKHPNVLKMYGFFSDNKNIYLLLELAEECLFRQINAEEGMSQSQASYYTKQVLESMKYMHSQSIIHRDIKPENILVAYGVAKIADFGWSVYSPIYKRQTFCGTLDYVSPQIVQGEFYDQKSDIWSLGVLIYQFVTGQAPFQGQAGQDDTFCKIMSGQVLIKRKVSSEVEELIRGILVRNPKKRLTLKDIDNSRWLKQYQKQGRYINPQIWNFWTNNNL